MTDDTTIVQARLSGDDADRLDADREALGLSSRSEAVREGLRLLHKQARYAALAREYDAFYSIDTAAISDVATVGDKIAVDVLGSWQ